MHGGDGGDHGMHTGRDCMGQSTSGGRHEDGAAAAADDHGKDWDGSDELWSLDVVAVEADSMGEDCGAFLAVVVEEAGMDYEVLVVVYCQPVVP